MTPALPTVVSQRAQPSTSVAKVAAQRYLNRASGRMETAQQIHTYHPPPSRPVPPPGHQTSNTTRTVTRTVTPPVKAPVSFINKNPAEVEATARQLTNAEVAGIRGAYQPENALLGQEQTGALGAHATSYGQLGSTISNLQTAQQGTAKTAENFAADALNKASTAAPGAAQAAERLGLKPGEKAPESVERQQEAARTLLSGIAQAGAAGTNARQTNEANFLTNMQGTAALGNTEGAKAIEGQYARQKGEVAGKEGAAIAKAEGNQASLGQKLFGEQEKLRIAAQGLGYKGQEVANRTQTVLSKTASERNKEKEGGIKLSQAQEKLAISKAGAESLASYREKSLTQKEAVDSANIKKTEAATAKLLNETKPGGGKPLTTAEKNSLKGEAAYIFNMMQRGSEEHVNLAAVRKELEAGSSRRSYSKYINGKGEPVNSKGEPTNVKSTGLVKSKAVKNPLLFTVAEQSIEHGYVNAATKQQLREAGLNDSGWSNLLYNQSGKSRK
jgi:hypothetical protein